MSKTFKHRGKIKGFTVMEIIIVVSTIAVISSFIFVTFASINSRESLDKSASLVSSKLSEARSLTLSSNQDIEYGVHFDSDQVVLFSGTTYIAGSSTNIVYPFNSRVNISNIQLNDGGSDIIFERLTGRALSYGTTTLYLKNSTTTIKSVYISPTGVVEVK